MDAAFTVRRRIIVAPGMILNSSVAVPDYTTQELFFDNDID